MTYAEFEAAVEQNRIKLVNLSDGDYVSKKKYDARIKHLTKKVSALSLKLQQLEKQMAENAADLTKDEWLKLWNLTWDAVSFMNQRGKFIGSKEHPAFSEDIQRQERESI